VCGIQLLRKFLRHLKVKEELENAEQIEKRERKFQVGEMDDSCSIGIKAGTYDEGFFTYIHFLDIALFLRGLTFSWFRKYIFYPS